MTMCALCDEVINLEDDKSFVKHNDRVLCKDCYEAIGEIYKDEYELMTNDEANDYCESSAADRAESMNDRD